MKIKYICDFYFNAFSILNHKKVLTKEKVLAKICISSYFFVLPPIIFGIGYIFSKISQSDNKTTKKTHESFWKVFNDKHHSIEELPLYPEVKNNVKPGFFVDILNKRGYSINGKNILIPPAGEPQAYVSSEMGFEKNLEFLKQNHEIDDTIKIDFQFKDQSTEQAINESINCRIALNFANEHHAGGGPGFHKDKDTHLFVYDYPSAKAQEESLCQRSDLMASLTQLPHTLKADSGTNFIRSYYQMKFDSKNTAYISMNSLFAVQKDSNFYGSTYLEEPKAVAFITSAAKSYAHVNTLDCRESSEVYQDAKQRITTHLLASAFQACVLKKENPDQKIELILGAFGCGAFAPKGNPNDYRKMIANLYKEFLPKFQGFFDVVTFAVPTFGRDHPSDAAVANYHIFRQVLNFKV